MLIKKSESLASRRRIPFEMIQSSDSMSPGLGLSFAAGDLKLYVNGTSEANVSGTIAEIGGGLYYYEAALAELGTLGQLTLRVNKAGYVYTKYYSQVVAFDPYDAVAYGLSSLPQSAASSAGGLPTVGTGAGQINLNGTGGADINLGMDVPFSDISAKTTQSIGDCLSAARAEGSGKWVVSGTTLTLYGPDGTTVVRAFTLNDPINPTQRS